MKRTLQTLGLAAGMLLSNVALAPAQELSGNISIASDYAFRGISQTLEKPAVQGGLDLAAPMGLYVGAWGSNVNFGEDLAFGDRAQLELDLYGGVAPSVAGFDLDAGLLYYAYPGAEESRDYNFLEAYLGIARALGPVTAELKGSYSPDFFVASGTGLFGLASLSGNVPGMPVSLNGSVGHQTIEENARFGTPDYTVWTLGASVDVLGSSIGGTLTGTDLNEAECYGGSDLCKTRAIVSISRSF